jgi:hypothetical protein
MVRMEDSKRKELSRLNRSWSWFEDEQTRRQVGYMAAGYMAAGYMAAGHGEGS